MVKCNWILKSIDQLYLEVDKQDLHEDNKKKRKQLKSKFNVKGQCQCNICAIWKKNRFTFSISREHPTTWIPRLTSSLETDSPIPTDAPVTKATRPCQRSISLSFRHLLIVLRIFNVFEHHTLTHCWRLPFYLNTMLTKHSCWLMKLLKIT